MHSEIPEPYKNTFPSLTEMDDGIVYYDCSLCGDQVEIKGDIRVLVNPTGEEYKNHKKGLWERRRSHFNKHLFNKHDSTGFCEVCNTLIPIGKGVYLGKQRGVHSKECFKIYQKETPREERLADKIIIQNEQEEREEYEKWQKEFKEKQKEISVLYELHKFFIGDIVYCIGRGHKGIGKITSVFPDKGVSLRLLNGEEFHIDTTYLKKLHPIIARILRFFLKFNNRQLPEWERENQRILKEAIRKHKIKRFKGNQSGEK